MHNDETKTIIGQYTNKEMRNMSNIISTVNQYVNGIIIRKVGSTVNYYGKESDNSWSNTDCKTVY